jgi:hypothetical protein
VDKVAGVIEVITDLTDRKHAEEVMRRHNEELAALAIHTHWA